MSKEWVFLAIHMKPSTPHRHFNNKNWIVVEHEKGETLIRTYQTLQSIEEDIHVGDAIRRETSDGHGRLWVVFLQIVGQRKPVVARQGVEFIIELFSKFVKHSGV